MKDKYFIDTNIVVDGFDDLQPHKEISLAHISNALQAGQGMISLQVAQEFLNASTRKFKTPLKAEDASLYHQKVLFPLCRIFPGLELYQPALKVMQATRYSFYDALIIACAKSGQCTILYSEDLPNGQHIDGLEIVNPFR